jgi:hypothetical protein
MALEIVKDVESIEARLKMLTSKIEGLNHYPDHRDHFIKCHMCRDIHRETVWLTGVAEALLRVLEKKELESA